MPRRRNRSVLAPDRNQIVAQDARFAEAYAQDESLVRAAAVAGYPKRFALSLGLAALCKYGCFEVIFARMHARDPSAAQAYAEEWGWNIVVDIPVTLLDRVQAQREALALQARGGLPLPCEIEFIRKPLSRRARRKAKNKETIQ